MQPATWLWLPLVLLAGAACSEGGPSDDTGGGPNTAQEGCIEQASPMADDAKTAEGIAIKDVLEVVRREHAAALTWPDGESTQIRFVASEAQALFVTSRDDPKYEAHRAVRCDDRVVVKTRARVTTDDGKFGVDIPELRLEIVKSNWIVGSSHGLPKSMLRGSYANTTAPAGKCLRGTSVGVSLSLSEPRFRGELANTISDVPCGQSDPNEGLTPSKGASW